MFFVDLFNFVFVLKWRMQCGGCLFAPARSSRILSISRNFFESLLLLPYVRWLLNAQQDTARTQQRRTTLLHLGRFSTHTSSHSVVHSSLSALVRHSAQDTALRLHAPLQKRHNRPQQATCTCIFLNSIYANPFSEMLLSARNGV